MMDPNLLRDRRFRPLFWTQFLGALNDNLFKNALIMLITLRAYSVGNVGSRQIVALSGGIFILPFFLFSASAGQLADKVSKSRLMVWIKVCEMFVMALGALGFILGNFPLLLSTLFLMGAHSAFFGPVKYSILPQLLTEDELVKANAWVEMGTFVAILLGTILGGALIATADAGPWLVGAAVLAVALLGYGSSLKIAPLKALSPSLKLRVNPILPTLEVMRLTRRQRGIFLSILGISWFWFLGAAVLSLLPVYCREFLRGDGSLIIMFLTLFSLGVGVGSLLCGRFSAGRLDLGLVPIGSLGVSWFAFDLFLIGQPTWLPRAPGTSLTVAALLANAGGWRLAADLFFLAVFGGLFIVPLYTLIQQRAPEAERSRVIAGNNIINALFMALAAALLMWLFSWNLPIPRVFLVLALLNLAVAAYVYTIIPEFLLRFICRVLCHVLYRLKVIGRDHLPATGPAIVVCNHVSFIDWLVLAGACPRPMRFVMHYSYFQMPVVRKIFKDAKVIPIAGAIENSQILESAFQRIAENLEAGEIVCIFPEGRLTTDGQLRKFRPGIETILKRTPVPVIPMALCGLWGSFFSRKDGKPLRRPFRRIWSRISLVVGPLVSPEDATAAHLQEVVGQLKSNAAA